MAGRHPLWHPEGMLEVSQGQAKRSPWNASNKRLRPEGTPDAEQHTMDLQRPFRTRLYSHAPGAALRVLPGDMVDTCSETWWTLLW